MVDLILWRREAVDPPCKSFGEISSDFSHSSGLRHS
ncbi:unnamed protein product [Arabidopsis halleri]